jgi:hypothetical protein
MQGPGSGPARSREGPARPCSAPPSPRRRTPPPPRSAPRRAAPPPRHHPLPEPPAAPLPRQPLGVCQGRAHRQVLLRAGGRDAALQVPNTGPARRHQLQGEAHHQGGRGRGAFFLGGVHPAPCPNPTSSSNAPGWGGGGIRGRRCAPPPPACCATWRGAADFNASPCGEGPPPPHLLPAHLLPPPHPPPPPPPRPLPLRPVAGQGVVHLPQGEHAPDLRRARDVPPLQPRRRARRQRRRQVHAHQGARAARAPRRAGHAVCVVRRAGVSLGCPPEALYGRGSGPKAQAAGGGRVWGAQQDRLYHSVGARPVWGTAGQGASTHPLSPCLFITRS